VTDLDPGIRETVLLLQSHGFATTDSGDGISKPAEERVMDFPHVACAVAPDALLAEADRMAGALGAEWMIEATYYPRTRQAILLATSNG
jgi:hypothetical protein